MATGGSADTSAVGVSVTSGASVGSYAIQVLALARAQSLSSGSLPRRRRFRGRHAAHRNRHLGRRADHFTPGTTAGVDITVEATDTLAQVRDKINAAGAGVTATILTDAGGSRLLLRSSETGAAHAFRTTVTDADGNDADASGLRRRSPSTRRPAQR